DDLDEALDKAVRPAAVVAREPAEGEAEQEADADSDKPDGKRNAGTIDDTGKHVAAEPIRALQKQRASHRRANQMEPPFDQAPKSILVTEAEKSQPLDPCGIGRVDPAQRLHVQPGVEAVDERPDEAPVVEEVDGLRRRVEEIRVPRAKVIGCEYFGNEDRRIQQGKEDARDDGKAVALELPPHQP